MKEKIMYLVIGALIGAVLTAGGFLIFGKNKSGMPSDMTDRSQMKQMDGNMTTPPDGSNGRMNKGENTTNSDTTSTSTNTSSNT